MNTAVRPTSYGGWASGPSGYVVEPIAADKAQGFLPTGIARSSYINWLLNAGYQWQRYFDQSLGVAFCGDASDGDLTLGGSGGTPTNYVMSRHMQFGDLAIGISGVLDTNGWVPYVRGVLTGVSGTIRSNGGTGGTGAGANSFVPGLQGYGASGPLCGGFGGGTGPLGSAGLPESPANALGGGGGQGGSGSVASGLPGGTCIAPSGLYKMPLASTQGLVHWSTPAGVTSAYLRGGAGGGQGGHGSSGAGGGGGGGGGGGVLMVVAQELNFVGIMQAKGGPGGPCTATGAGNPGGGAGGGGGAVVVTYGRKTALVVTVDTSGGPGGAGSQAGLGATGAAGLTGPTGVIENKLAA